MPVTVVVYTVACLGSRYDLTLADSLASIFGTYPDSPLARGADLLAVPGVALSATLRYGAYGDVFTGATEKREKNQPDCVFHG